MKSYEVITATGKSVFLTAKSKKSIYEFMANKPKRVVCRPDIDPSQNLKID